MYTPLTPDQFTAAQKAGFSTAQITANEKIRMQKENANVTPTQTPTQTPTTDNPQYATNDSVGNKVLQAGNTTASVLGIQKAGQGLATAGRVISGAVNQTSAEEGQAGRDQQAVINKLQQLRAQGVPKTDLKYMQLENFLKRTQGQSTVTQAQVDPGTQLSNKEVAGSFGNVALLATAPGLPTGGSTLAGRVAAGAATGYAADVAQAANDNKDNIYKPGVGTIVGGSLPIVTAVGGAIAKRFTGLTTGAGKDVIQRAVDNPSEVNAAINKYAKTPEAKQQLVNKVEDTLNGLVTQRNTEYQQGLNNLVVNHPNTLKANEIAPKINQLNEAFVAKPTAANKKALDQAVSTYHELLGGTGINKDTVVNSFMKNVKNFGGKLDSSGQLVFKNSALTTTDRTNLTKAWEDLSQWTDVTPQGFDALRQNIGNYMNDFKIAGNSRANVVLGNVKKDLTTEMSSKIPGYSKMLSNYGDKSEAIQALKADLFTNSNSPTTQLNKVMRVFKKDPSVIKTLTEQVGQKGANKLLNDISGAILSDWLPKGTVSNIARGTAETGAIAAGALLHVPGALPAAAAGAAAASPRIVGKSAVLAGKAIKSGLAAGTKKAATIAASKANR